MFCVSIVAYLRTGKQDMLGRAHPPEGTHFPLYADVFILQMDLKIAFFISEDFSVHSELCQPKRKRVFPTGVTDNHCSHYSQRLNVQRIPPCPERLKPAKWVLASTWRP